jgi:hypothetical protein
MTPNRFYLRVATQVYRNLSELVNLEDVGMLYLEFVVTEDKLGK